MAAICSIFEANILWFQNLFSSLMAEPTNLPLVQDYDPNTPLTPILSDLDPEPSEEMVNKLPEQLNEFPACKCQALEDMMNAAKQ
jgi:hypothetical protein